MPWMADRSENPRRIPDAPSVPGLADVLTRCHLRRRQRDPGEHQKDADSRAEDEDAHALRRPAPSRPRGHQRHKRRPGHLAEVSRKVVGPQSDAAASFFVCSGDQRGAQGMLRPGPQAADHQERQERNKSSRRADAEESDRGEERSGGQHPGFAPAFGEEPRGNLEQGQRAGVPGAEQPHLRKGERELTRPHREERVEEIGTAVVQEVDGAARGQGRARVALAHGGDSFNRAANCQARPRDPAGFRSEDNKGAVRPVDRARPQGRLPHRGGRE